ncbi:MAG TPA: hypothetical protein VFG83_16710 [Kofleriaceae bacterium]|nr:hypothetical protein [Kofleriaceae bacterium]
MSSLLVRDGLVGVKRMERAFQRQVIYGGALDTILLEMDAVPEDRLVQYLSLATGLPPATRAELGTADPEIGKVFSEHLATEYQVAPLSADGDTVRVLVRDPVDLPALENLANELSRPIQPMVAPEYRYSVIFDRAFGREPKARFAKLEEAAARAPVEAPVGKPQSIIVTTERDGAPAVAAPPKRRTMEISTTALARHQAEAEEARKQADETHGRSEPARNGKATETAPEVLAEAATVSAVATQAEPAANTETRPASDPTKNGAPGKGAVAGDLLTAGQPSPVAAAGTTPLSAIAAREGIAAAEKRDEIFEILLRAIRGQATFAALLTVQGGAAIGRLALTGDVFDTEEIARVLIPLDESSAFKKSVESASPYIGPVASGHEDLDAMTQRLGGVMPPAALLLPVAIRGRVVALAIGHRHNEPIGIAEVAELLPIAGAAADRLAALIVKAKSAIPEPATADEPTQKLVRSDRRAPDTNRPANDLAAILDRIASGDSDDAEAAIKAAMAQPAAAVTEIGSRFPGPLTTGRPSAGSPPLSPAEHGPILDLVCRLGPAAGKLVAEKLADRDPDTRYFAAVCARALCPAEAREPLIDLVFDDDDGLRLIAVIALIEYPDRDLKTALKEIRTVLREGEPARVEAAARAVERLADHQAIPDLITALDRASAAECHGALVALTFQDLGQNARKWRSWWQKNERRHPMEWSIDSLMHKDGALRRAAADSLRSASGEYFDFDPEGSKRDRAAGQKSWQKWWDEKGRRRFASGRDRESRRRTALLPTQRP